MPQDPLVEKILNIEGTPDLTGIPALADGGTSVSLQGNYMIMGYEPRSHEFGVMGILDPGFMTGNGQMFYVEEDDLVDWYIENSEEYGNPEVRALQKAFESPSVEHPLGPHTGSAIVGDSVKFGIENNNLKKSEYLSNMDLDRNFEDEYISVELDRSSMPDEHISSAMTPEELEALLAGGEGKGWTDVPEDDRPHGWGEEIVEGPHGTEYKRIIDPDLERGDKEDAKAHGLANKPFPTQGLRGASTKTSFSDSGWEVVQDEVSKEDPYKYNYIHFRNQDGSDLLANNVSIDLGEFDVIDNVDYHGLGGGIGEHTTDIDRGQPKVSIESVAYSQSGNLDNPDVVFTGQEIPSEIVNIVNSAIHENPEIIDYLDDLSIRAKEDENLYGPY